MKYLTLSSPGKGFFIRAFNILAGYWSAEFRMMKKYLFLILFFSCLLFVTSLFFDNSYFFSFSMAAVFCSLGLLIGQFIREKGRIKVNGKRLILLFVVVLIIDVLISLLLENKETAKNIIIAVSILGGLLASYTSMNSASQTNEK